MSHPVAEPPEHGSFRKLWYAAAFTGLVAFTLSAWASWQHGSGSPLLHRTASALYFSVQVMLLHGDAPWDDDKLDVAKILAALTVGATAVLTVLQVFKKSAALWLLDWRRGHAIVCGLNATGIELVKDFRRRRPVVVVERNPDNEFIPTAVQTGAMVLIGDAADALTLRRARLHRAGYLMALSGDDGANMEIAAHAGGYLKTAKALAGQFLHCYVRIVDLDLRNLFRRQQLHVAPADRMTVGIFNPFESSARQLFEAFPLEPPGLDAADPRSVRLVIIGFGQMGRAVALQAAKLGHFGNGKKVLVSVFDQHATAKRLRFETEFPYYDVACTSDFQEGDVETPAVLERLAELSRQMDAITTFVVCFDDDGHSLSFGLRLLQKLVPGTRIRLRISSSRGFAALMPKAEESAPLPAHLRAFGQIDRIATVETVVGGQIDLLAKKIHAEFVRKRTLEGRTPELDAAMVPWEVLSEVFVESNRQQADHIAVKLRAISCHGAPHRSDERPVEFSEAEVELLAKMEHARWNAERSLAGWTFAPGYKDLDKKTSPYLVGWDELPEFVRKYDSEAVRAIPKLLAAINQSIYR